MADGIGAADGSAHRLSVRVYYEDTDFSGFVYHGSYVRFLERGRSELLREVLGDHSTLHREARGLVFVVRRMSLDFARPAAMDDLLSVLTRTLDVRGASMRFAQAILREDEPLVTAEVTVACVREGRAVRLPEALRASLARRAAP